MGKFAYQLLAVGGGALAALAARKAMTIVWEKSLHKPVPLNPADDDAGLPEALAWTIVSGVGVAVAQLIVQRYAVRTVRSNFGEAALPKNLRKNTDV